MAMSAEFPTLTHRERLPIVIGALVTMFLAALDQMIVAPALPTLGATLGHAEWLSWVVSVYLLAASAVTPLYGRLADSRGRRPTVLAALAIFVAGSAICGAAQTMPMLLIGRAVQGLGGGGLIALAQTMIGDVVPPRERAMYNVHISALWATASIAGPILGGFFTEHLHWSMIFWLNLPIGLVAFLISRKALARLPDVRHPRRMDLVGTALVVLATLAVMLALTWAGRGTSWTSPYVLGGLILGGLLYLALWRWLTTVDEPLIPPHVLTHPVALRAYLALFFLVAANITVTVFTPAFLQAVHGLTPSGAGLAMVGQLIGTTLGANTSARIMKRTGRYKRAGVIGWSGALVIYGLLAAGAASLPLAAVLLLLIGGSVGMGTCLPLITVSVQNTAARADLGMATAGLSFVRTLGGVFGMAIGGAVFILAGAGEVLGEHIAGGADAGAMAGAYRMLLVYAFISHAIGLIWFVAMEELPLRGGGSDAGE